MRASTRATVSTRCCAHRKTDYFDIMLLHWQHTANWVSESARWQDGILAAQERKTIRTRGASVHGLPALRQMPGNKWLQIAMIRMNHNGTRMDGPIMRTTTIPAIVHEVVAHVKQVEERRHGRDQHEAGGRWNVHAARTTARPPCASRSRMPAWIA